MVREVLSYALWLYMIAVVLYMVLSWFPIAPGSVVEFVQSGVALVAEPPLNQLRRVLPRAGGIDFSPLILIIALQIVGSVVLRWQDFGFWTLL